MSDALDRRPEARTETVEELVLRVRRGEVRVPSFQRGLRWEARNVLELFDSILRGYPVGSLLLWERAAEAERVKVGPLQVDAPEKQAAWWVVDGQQRLTALTVGLSRPVPLPTEPTDPYVVYFDAAKGEFQSPDRSGEVPDSWVPAPLLADSATLLKWMRTWSGGQEDVWVDRVLEAGKRLREYVVPLYVIRTDDEATLRDIFYRSNESGVRLAWKDVHRALFGASRAHPTTLPDLADELAAVGVGRPDEDALLRCLFALRGLDPTRSPGEHIRKHRDLVADAAADALPALRRALSFLRRDAGIAHLRLLPRSTVLAPLTRWFALHSEPGARSNTLLSRWVWRLFVSEPHLDERTLLRRSVERIGDDEEQSVQELLALLPREAPDEIDLGSRFDSRAARTRLALLAMAQARPKDLLTGEPLDVAGLIEAHDRAAFVALFPGSSSAPWGRLLHRPVGAAELRAALAAAPADALQSHLVTEEAAAALRRGEAQTFLADREQALRAAVRRVADRYAGWSRRDADRPSIQHLLEQVEAEAAS